MKTSKQYTKQQPKRHQQWSSLLCGTTGVDRLMPYMNNIEACEFNNGSDITVGFDVIV
jgi:hypothetical protein